MANTVTLTNGQDRVDFIREFAWKNGLNPLAVEATATEAIEEDDDAGVAEFILSHDRAPDLEDEENNWS